MASIRSLKKDIDFLVDEVYVDCQLYLHFNKDKNIDDVDAILRQLTELRNSLYDRINHPQGDAGSKQIHAHYKAIVTDLKTGVNDLFEQVSKLAR